MEAQGGVKVVALKIWDASPFVFKQESDLKTLHALCR